MQIGTVIYEPTIVEGFELPFFYVKRADGAVGKPARGMYNDITCFADASTIRKRPELVALSKNGPAIRTNKQFSLPWDFVCPTNDAYQTSLLEFIRCVSEEDVRGVVLSLYHFPEEGFCICDRCLKARRLSGLGWIEWRVSIVSDFVKEAKEIVDQSFAVEIWPDPILAKERFGLDFDELAEHVDFFHVPLSSQNYVTMYWVDTLTRGFTKILKKPVYIELSAEVGGEVEIKALLRTMAYVSKQNIDAILLLVHTAERAREIRRIAVQDSDFNNWLEEFQFSNMIDIIEKWAKFL